MVCLRHKQHCIKKEPARSGGKSSNNKSVSLVKVKQERTSPKPERRHSTFPQPDFGASPSSLSKSKWKSSSRRHSLPATQVTTMNRAERKLAFPRGGGGRTNRYGQLIANMVLVSRLVPAPGKGFACPDCGKEFISKSKMTAHNIDIHQPGEFPCPGIACGKVFTSKNKQTSHYSK